MAAVLQPSIADVLRRGAVIPAHPLALDEHGRLDEQCQHALTRYYIDAGAGGIAVGVHTTQFQIREPAIGLYEPVLQIAAEAAADTPLVKVAGVCGDTWQATAEAMVAAELGYDLALVSFGSVDARTEAELVRHLATIGDIMPVFGFFLQPLVGGRPLSLDFWSKASELPCLAAVKIAPFDRYRTLDVVRAVAQSGRLEDISLYTGNDDNIVVDWLTTYRFGTVEATIVGGLLGQAAIWTRSIVALHQAAQTAKRRGEIPSALLTTAAELTDVNGAVFDATNDFRGCIAGIHEVLRRQGLVRSTRCLPGIPPLSPRQAEQIDRVIAAHPHLTDNEASFCQGVG